jgi:CRP-like cAMP-binding protein
VRFGFPSEDHDVLRNHWGYTLDLGLTHQAIAESIGSTRVTVTRLLNQFEAQKKLVKLSRQKIFLQMPIHVQN